MVTKPIWLKVKLWLTMKKNTLLSSDCGGGGVAGVVAARVVVAGVAVASAIESGCGCGWWSLVIVGAMRDGGYGCRDKVVSE